jgi:hypothetical protein
MLVRPPASVKSLTTVGDRRVTRPKLERAIARGRGCDDDADVMPVRLHFLSADYERSYLFALGHDAEVIARSPGVRILRRLPDAVVVETDFALAIALREGGEYVAVYDSAVEALLAVALFDWTPFGRSLDP